LLLKPIPGYQGENRSIRSENIFGLTYENARVRANELMTQINNEKADQLLRASRSIK
jgi:hypothetical protein